MISRHIGAALPWLGLATWAASAQAAVVTPYQVFADCNSAKQFRDVELPKKLDTEFDRYKRGVQTRVDDVIKEFKASLDKSKIDLRSATASQRKEVSIAASRLFASLLLKKYAAEMKGPWRQSYDALPDGQKKAVDVIVAKTNGLSDLTFDAARGKQLDFSDALKPYADATVEALSWALGPVSKGVVELIKGGADIGSAYLEFKPNVDFSTQQVEFWRRQVGEMIQKSPNAQIQTINAAKRAIDSACGG